jgi:hypothetical protein
MRSRTRRINPVIIAITFGPVVGSILAAPSAVCDVFAEENGQQMSIVATGLAQVPINYYGLARSINVDTADQGVSISPFATEQKGRKVIIFPLSFAKVVCEVVLARYLNNEGVIKDAILDSSAATAAMCLDVGRTQRRCLTGFAADLAKSVEPGFARLPDARRQAALSICRSVVRQITLHEYSHHFLDHVNRIKSGKITRQDAEFESDLFAVLDGVQDGEPAMAMAYFFSGIADIERHATRRPPNDYESGSCRATNIENIYGFLGLAPTDLLDAAAGGGYTSTRGAGGTSTTPSLMKSRGKELFGGKSPKLIEGSCGYIGQAQLKETRQELEQLYMRMLRDVDFLFQENQTVDLVRAENLVRDLSEMSGSFQHLGSLTAKCVALVLLKWLFRNNISIFSRQVDQLLDDERAHSQFLAEDYGLLLTQQGVATLRAATNLPAKMRLDRSFELLQRAVLYAPNQTNAWSNLSILALVKADCASAARFADRSLPTVLNESDAKGIAGFAKILHEVSEKPGECTSLSAKFRVDGFYKIYGF